jgi:hypothetical protein
MNISTSRRTRRSILVAAVGLLLVVFTACTGRGGGQLPPQAPFTGAASLGFTFSCQDKGGINSPTGRLAIELAYGDKGTNVANPVSKPFGIHGIVDTIDPVLESAVCIGQNPPPASEFGNQLVFLGRYRPTTTGFPKSCPAKETKTAPLCRFEVIVRDNDQNFAPSPGDYFSIKLSSVTSLVTECLPDVEPPCYITEFPVGTVLYARAGFLSSGNITVK